MEGHEEEGDEEGAQGKEGDEETVTAAAAALAAMVVGEASGVQEEEEEEDECSVCLNAIEGSDSDNPAGPDLACGHRYHAFCLRFWVERCMSKCIEPTCPYCRAPLLGM